MSSRKKEAGIPKRKARVLSDSSDDEDFDFQQKKKVKDTPKPPPQVSTPKPAPEKKQRKGEVNVKSLPKTSAAAMFGSVSIKKYFSPVTEKPKPKPETVVSAQKADSDDDISILTPAVDMNSNVKSSRKRTPETTKGQSSETHSKVKSSRHESPEKAESHARGSDSKGKSKRHESPEKVESHAKRSDSNSKSRQHDSPKKGESPAKTSDLKTKSKRHESPEKAESQAKGSDSKHKSKRNESPEKAESHARRSDSKSKSKRHETPEKVESHAKGSDSKSKSKRNESPEKAESFARGSDSSKGRSSSKTPSKSKPRAKSGDKESKSKVKLEKTKTPDKPKKGDTSTSTPELTAEEQEKKRRQSANYFKHLSRGAPKNLGSKEIPIGAPDCLEGLTFVLTGVLDSLERDDVSRIVGKYGGRVTGGVSGKTTHLIVGDEPGESKIKRAKDLKVPLISEDDLLEMIRKSNPNQPESQTMFGCSSSSDEEEAPKLWGPPPKDKKLVQGISPSKDSGVGSSQSQTPELFSTPKQSKREEAKTKVPLRAPVPEASTSTTKLTKPVPPVDASTLMWVDKYKPNSVKNIVGQAGEKSNAQKLVKWLSNWFQYHGKAGEKAKTSWPGLKDPEGKTFKAALLSGPPGIGKTSTAHLVCKQVGYDFFEMNASDTRNKRGLHEIVSDALTSKSIMQTGPRNELTSKHVLIMDEVDGMSGNEDRGGIQELINLIKGSRVPIICICNDRNHQKIRSLANYCFDLRFNKPTNEQLKGFMQSICFKEKLRVPVESVQQLINSSDHDIRQILNQLELLKESKSQESICNPRKDLKFGPWDVCRKVFSATEHRGMSIHDKNNLFFQDYSFGPLFVQENYLKWTPMKAKGNRYKALDRIKQTAEAIATGDLVDNLIRRSNNWSLLPTQAVFSSILPGELMEGNEVSGIEFPRWLGKNSTRNKMSRLLQQLHTHVHLEISGSLEALNMDYLPYLRRSIVNPLVGGEIDTAVDTMQTYSLLREDLDNINELALWPDMRNPFEKLDPKTKSAFTRKVNKKLVVPYAVDTKITKGKKKSSKAAEGSDEEMEVEEGHDEDDLEMEADY